MTHSLFHAPEDVLDEFERPPGAVPPHIHVVEDDPSMQRALTTALTRSGYSVGMFDSMETYLAGPRNDNAAMLILDMRLPGQSGLALRQWLAQQGDNRPVIFISGDSTQQEIIDALQGGAREFLLKPFRLDALMAAVDRAFATLRAQRAEADRLARLRKGWVRLTAREREVCVLMLRGMANREIARLHGSVSGTVKVHRGRVLDKMEVASLSALFELAGNADLDAWLQEPDAC